MKRLWFIPILMSFLVFFSFWSIRAGGLAAEDMERITQSIVQKAEAKDAEHLLMECQALDSAWKKHYKTLRLFLNRNELNQISLVTSELISAALHQEWEECIQNANRCNTLVFQLKQSESFHLGVFL